MTCIHTMPGVPRNTHTHTHTHIHTHRYRQTDTHNTHTHTYIHTHTHTTAQYTTCTHARCAGDISASSTRMRPCKRYTCCNMLQHAATCCNMLQHAATFSNKTHSEKNSMVSSPRNGRLTRSYACHSCDRHTLISYTHTPSHACHTYDTHTHIIHTHISYTHTTHD